MDSLHKCLLLHKESDPVVLTYFKSLYSFGEKNQLKMMAHPLLLNAHIHI